MNKIIKKDGNFYMEVPDVGTWYRYDLDSEVLEFQPMTIGDPKDKEWNEVEPDLVGDEKVEYSGMVVDLNFIFRMAKRELAHEMHAQESYKEYMLEKVVEAHCLQVVENSGGLEHVLRHGIEAYNDKSFEEVQDLYELLDEDWQ